MLTGLDAADDRLRRHRGQLVRRPRLRDLLDGPLAPLRNVHKVDPAIRLPLALGTAQAVRLLAVWVARRRPRAGGGPVRAAVLPSVVVAVLLVVTAAPLATGGLRHQGWEQVPDGWREAVAHLEAHDDGGAVLVVPATAFGMQRWGRTVDEPIQALYDGAWVARTQIPLVPTATIRWMDGIEARLETGVGSPRLADTLAGRWGHADPGPPRHRPGGGRRRRPEPRRPGPVQQPGAGPRGVLRTLRLRRPGADRRLPGRRHPTARERCAAGGRRAAPRSEPPRT